MNKDKKIAPVTTPEREKTKERLDGSTSSNGHNITTDQLGQGLHIVDFLCTGQAHAIPLRDLVALTNQDGRTVRLEIERARRNGIPILSNSKDGYWIGEDTDEIAHFVQGMKRRARQIQLTAEAVGEAAGIGNE